MSTPPNILYILTDQQRLSTMSTYGATPCLTPNLDALAKRSVVFDNAYTPCPLCTPARASMITGLYPHQHGMTANTGNTGCAVHNLRDRPTLLPRRLQKAGYDCVYTGKWHLGMYDEHLYLDKEPPSLPRDVGFIGHNFAGHGGGGFQFPEYKAYLEKHGYQHALKTKHRLGKGYVPNFGILEGPEASTVPYFLTEHSLAQIDRCAESAQPFFLWHNFWGPHEPYFAVQEYYDLYRDVSIPEWPNYRWPAAEHEGPHRAAINPSMKDLKWSDWEEAIRHYYAFMTLIDKQVGRMVAKLEETGLIDNTLIVFASDHGESLGSHGGLMDKGIFHFEEIQRVPLLAKLPNERFAGTRRDELVSLLDLYPTFLDFAEAPLEPNPVAGHSLLELLEERAPWREDLVVVSEGVENINVSLRTLRHGPYKYCFSMGMKEALYNLEADPHEMVNLAEELSHSAVINDLRTRLIRWMREQGDRLIRTGAMPYFTRMGWTDESN